MNMQDWIYMREGLIDKICDQEKEITNLKDQLKHLQEQLRCELPRSNISTTPASEKIQNTMNPKELVTSCFLIGDSHVRGLQDLFSQITPTSCKIGSFFQPSAGFHDIAEVHVQSPNLINAHNLDCIVIMCGTNDVCSSPWYTMQKALDILLLKFRPCKQILVIGIPLRYNITRLNSHTHRLNTKIKKYVMNKSSIHNQVTYIDSTKFIKPRHYARDGLHFNKLGKIKLCEKIKCAISSKFSLYQNRTNRVNHTENIENIEDIEISLVSESEIPPLEKPYPAPTTSTQTPYILPNIPHYHYQYDIPLFDDSTFTSTPHFNCNPMPNVNSSHSYYRLTQRTNLTVNSNDSVLQLNTPIPRIEPGFNRPQQPNFSDPGQTSKT